MRIRSAGQAGKTSVFELIKLRLDLSVQNSVQNRNQRLGCGVVSWDDVGRPNGVGSSVPRSEKAGYRGLVEDVQDVQVEGQPKPSVIAKVVMVRPRKIRLRKRRSSSQIASLD